MSRLTVIRSLSLFVLMVAIYFFTFTGQSISSDELILLDAARSVALHGNTELAFTNDLRSYKTDTPSIVVSLDSEPLQAYAAAGLMWLASRAAGWGLIPAAMMLNVFVTAAGCVLFYLWALALGYVHRTALITVLLYGLCTYTWSYSQLFFREPLFITCSLLSVLSVEKLRHGLEHKRLYPLWLLWAITGLAGAVLTKEAALLLLPPLLIVALPGSMRRLLDIRLIVIILGLLSIVAFLFIVLGPYLGGRYTTLLERIRHFDMTFFKEAMSAYLLSPGSSLWALSPILLAGWGGFLILVRQRHWRMVILPIVAVSTYTLTYALRGYDWYSGAGWGVRYLLPAIPFMAIWLLPVVSTFGRWRGWLRAVFVGLVTYSLALQLLAVTMPIRAFPNYLDSEGLALNDAINPWQLGTWHPVYLPYVVLAHQSGAPSEIAWVVNNAGSVVVPLCIIGAIAAGLALTRPRWRWVGLAGVMVLLTLIVGLRSYYLDRRYGGELASLWSVLNTLEREVQPTDGIILSSRTYRLFFMNYYRASHLVYALPISPGEQQQPGVLPEIISDNPEERVHPFIPMLVGRLAAKTQRWWFLTEYTPFTGQLRVTENYLVRHYFVGETRIDRPDARLLLFSSISAPPPTIPPWPTYSVDATWKIATLQGYDLPAGKTLMPNKLFPISLLWRHDGWPADISPFDYSINISIVDSTGYVVAQLAGPPQGGFVPMSTWQRGYYRDNRALQLPTNLPSGEYAVWVLIFDWRDNHKLPVYYAAGQTLGDYLLLTHIHVP